MHVALCGFSSSLSILSEQKTLGPRAFHGLLAAHAQGSSWRGGRGIEHARERVFLGTP